MRFRTVGESRQPRAIFQFPFLFWQVDNKESKNKYSSIALELFGAIVHFFCMVS